MARPFVFPDFKDCSINSPSVIVSQTQVLGLYNQDKKGDDRRERVVESVQTWFKTEAIKEGWSKAEFHGNQCALSVDLKKID